LDCGGKNVSHTCILAQPGRVRKPAKGKHL
jgi:hypothetical protein